MVLYRFLNSPPNCVLCFDGLMLLLSFIQSLGTKFDLTEMQNEVYVKLGINIQLAVKEMTEGFDFSGVSILPYVKPVPPNTFDFADPYDYQTFNNQYVQSVFSSRSEMEEEINMVYPRCITRLLHGEGCFVKKEYDVEKGDFDVVKGLGSSDLTLRYYEQSDDDPEAPTKKSIKLSSYLCSLPAFGNLVCDLVSTSNKNFNVWTGFQAKRVSKPASEGLELMKKFLFDIWACGDPIAYAYIVSWVAGLVTNLTGINQVALVMVSRQGAGKGTFLEFLEYILRKTNILSVNGVDAVVGKFNRLLQGKRLINMNEMSSTAETFRSNFDKLKMNITDTTILIQPKGVDHYSVKNISNYLLFTNHRDAVMVEESDRR